MSDRDSFDESVFGIDREPDSVRAHLLEARYGELYADIVGEGYVTDQKRAELSAAAAASGLDFDRVCQIERAIQAALDARRASRSDEDALADSSPTPTESLAPFAVPSDDPRLGALLGRIAFLEAEAAELRRALEAAELENEELKAGVPSRPPVRLNPAELHHRFEASPRDVELLHALFRSLRRDADHDRRLRVARALVHLEAADAAASELVERHLSEELLKPARPMTPDDWRDALVHDEQEALPGAIFAIIAPQVLIFRFASMRASHELPRLDPSKRLDPTTTTVQAVRCFSWAAAILGLRAPPLYADPSMPGFAEIVPDVQPATRLGAAALSRRTPRELAFLAGRHLSSYREEHLVGTIVSSHRELEDLFLAALAIVNPGLPMHADMRGRVAPLVESLRPLLQAGSIERLRALFLRFVEQGGRTDLRRWTRASDLTAARAGLLLADDLDVARAMLHLEDPANAGVRMDDLLGFYTGERATALRRKLGVAVLKPEGESPR